MRVFWWVPLVLAAQVAADEQLTFLQGTNTTDTTTTTTTTTSTTTTTTTTTTPEPKPQEIACGEFEHSSDMMVQLIEEGRHTGVMGVIINQVQFMTTAESYERWKKIHNGQGNFELSVQSRRGEHQVDRRLPPDLVNKGRKGLPFLVFTVLQPFTPWTKGGPNRVCYDPVLANILKPPFYRPAQGLLVMDKWGRRDTEFPVQIIQCPCWYLNRYICILDKNQKLRHWREYEGAMLTVKQDGRQHLLGLYTPGWRSLKCGRTVNFARVLKFDQEHERASLNLSIDSEVARYTTQLDDYNDDADDDE